MKALVKTRQKKEKTKKKGVIKPKPTKEQVRFVEQEINFVRKLSGNDKKTRDRMLKALKKWIAHCFEKGYEFKEVDFARVWKGLFYAVWMSDKPLIQEELCDNIAGILDLFRPEQLKYALLMAKAGFKKLATEWFGIDHHRMDKFLMLVRRYLRGSLRCLDRCGWSVASCQKYAKMLSGTDGLFAVNTPHYARNATSMLLHFADCFLEELSKVSKGKIEGESMAALLRPFMQYMCSGTNVTVCTATRRMLTALLRQSDIGLEYEERTRAWKQMGCPAGGPDALEPASDDDDDETQAMQNGDGDHKDEEDDEDSGGPLDPRAGRVDVSLAQLPVPARALADMLANMLATAASAAHTRLRICLQRLEKLAAGEYPLPVSVPEVTERVRVRPTRAARSLRQLELKLRADADELKLRGLSRKHKKRLLRKCRAGLSIVEDVEEFKKSLAKDSHNGEWLVESAEDKTKSDKDTSNKENQQRPKNNKLNTQKRKHDTQNGEVSNKKRKLDRNKSNLANADKKKNDIVENNEKKDNLVENNKRNLVKNNKTNLVAKKEKKLKPNKSTKVSPKQKDVKSKVKDSKDTAKAPKPKKPKNQPQIIPDKIKLSQKTNKSEETIIEKETAKKRVEPKIVAEKPVLPKKYENPKVLVNRLRNFQKHIPIKEKKGKIETPMKNQMFSSPKKVKFELNKNSMQKPIDYYKSVRQSPNIPFDGSKKPTKTNLKPSTPSPINPFFKKKLRMKL